MSEVRPTEGRFFEDFDVGRVFRHAIPRTLTEADASLYIALTGARQPLHCSRPLAAAMGHRATPLDDLLVFHVAFGRTVPDISYNAIANLGYADVRFLEPVYAGDTITCESEVIGAKANSNGRSGVVYVRSRAINERGADVLTWIRWVMVASRAPLPHSNAVLPLVPEEVKVDAFRVPAWLEASALGVEATGGARLWNDYQPGEVIDHPAGMTLEEADHMLATRLYQNPARIHFDAFLGKSNPFGRRLVYGGHIMSVCRALSFDGLENAFALAAIHGGRHSNPSFAGETIYCRHVVTSRSEIPGRADVGALRLRMLGVKDRRLAELGTPAPGEKHPAVVLDLDYSVLIPRRQQP
jgi:2-methylfumaryl-CoA hydratase